MTKLSRYLDTLTQSPDEARAENLKNWAASIPNAVSISEAKPRERCKVAGVIQNIRIDPREGSGAIEATFIDGTGRMVAKWLGRHTLSGIRLGMGIVIEGVLGTGPDKDLVVLNPEYELVPGPEHG